LLVLKKWRRAEAKEADFRPKGAPSQLSQAFVLARQNRNWGGAFSRQCFIGISFII